MVSQNFGSSMTWRTVCTPMFETQNVKLLGPLPTWKWYLLCWRQRKKPQYSQLVHRDNFTKSGEVSNFSRSFTGVPFRNLAEIPRCAENLKASILGQAAVGVGVKGKSRVSREVEARGHPLFWSEWKPVQLYS